jgi:hypothetical protein
MNVKINEIFSFFHQVLLQLGVALSSPSYYSYLYNPYQTILPTYSVSTGLQSLTLQPQPVLSRFATLKTLIPLSSPSAASALAYLKTVNANDLCSRSAAAYLETVVAGGTADQAAAAATVQYQADFAAGLRLEPGSACEASDIAWRTAAAQGADPVLASAQAFMAAWPGTRAGNPCAVSGTEYVKAILGGASHLAANLAAAKSFAAATTALAAGGAEVRDPACAAAARAYIAATPAKPSEPNAAAALAFIDKAFADPVFQVDPVCWKATEAFVGATTAGADELTSNLAAAEAFLEAFATGGIPADSPCAAATRAYAAAVPLKPSGPNALAMAAFMDAMTVQGNTRVADPICAAAAQAYFAAHKAGKDELAANLAAGRVFLQAYKAGGGAAVPANSPCLAAARVYADQIRQKPSPPSAAAMLTFFDEAVLTNLTKPDPVCLASAEAFLEAHAAGASEAKANEAAGLAYLDAVAATPSFNPGSACGRAAQAYIANFGVPSYRG